RAFLIFRSLTTALVIAPLSLHDALPILAATGEARAIDVGSVNGRTFINVASAGFGAEVTAETPEGIKRILGGAAYGLMGLVKALDRKSTRLNSSHVKISYAVFCLKKETK